jgi:tetratricopeptide (TPR) repeat protein
MTSSRLVLVSSLRWGLIALGLTLAANLRAEGPPATPPAKSKLGGAVAVPSSVPAPAAPAPTPAPALAVAPTPAPAAPVPTPAPAVNAIDQLVAAATDLADHSAYAAGEIEFYQVLHNPEATARQQNTALLGLAHLYRKQGALTKAAAIYERFLKDRGMDDRVPDALLELGRTLRDMSAYSMALNRFYSVINSTLKFPSQGFEHYERVAKTAQFEIAQTHFAAGDYQEAGKYFLKVRLLDLAPSDQARALFMAAYSQQLAGEYEAAVTTLTTYLAEWPDDSNGPEARYLLATTLRQLNRPQEAMAATLELLKAEHGRGEKDPRRWIYWQRRTGNQVANELFQTGDVLNALAIYQGLAATSKDAVWRLPVVYQIALCYERLGQLDAARQAYREIAASADPELAKMAGWRLAHLDWRDKTEQQFLTSFDSSSPHDSPGSAAAAPTDLRPTSPARAGGEPVPPTTSKGAGTPPAGAQTGPVGPA